MSSDLWIEVTYRGNRWRMHPLTVAGTWVTMQVKDRSIDMPCSVLEFSLWDATCKQIPDMSLDDDAVEALRPWLLARETRWRLGWSRPRTTTKTRETDPRQLKLFE